VAARRRDLPVPLSEGIERAASVREGKPRHWHILASEYAPAIGGVADHTRILAEGLAVRGCDVQVWAPGTDQVDDATMHYLAHGYSLQGLRELARQLDRTSAPRRLLVQWVPHGFGWRSMNVAFCLWLLKRAIFGDEICLIVHEPFLSFGEGSLKQDLAAVVHRVMTVIILLAASRVWVTIPAWKARLQPYALGRDLGFDWLPVPSNVPAVSAPAGAAEPIRAGLLRGAESTLVGHFGAYSQDTRSLLDRTVPQILARSPTTRFLFLGAGSQGYVERFAVEWPELVGRVTATGLLPAGTLSPTLAACDLALQPYADGVSTRRSSVMAMLAHGRAVVTTRGVHTEPFWESAGGVALSPVDATQLIASTLALIGDPQRRARLGAAAARLYQDRFDKEHVVNALVQVST
jgi:glycosyltransferase involved in cell wall biosynthesis